MYARSCQLCGKPLSRLRVGSDGDFCSKEHRSQFRLRAGMDRLVEVNKVASLMRRRESAKQISPSMLLCNSNTGRHGFLDSKPPTVASSSRLVVLRIPASAAPHIGSPGERFILPRKIPAQGPIPPRTSASAVHFAEGNLRPEVPHTRQYVVLAFPQTAAITMRSPATSGVETRRDFPAFSPAGIRAQFGAGPAALRGIHSMQLERATGIRSFASHPVKGNAWRVSAGVAFRMPRAHGIQRQPGIRTYVGLAHVVRPGKLPAPDFAISAQPRIAGIALPEIPARFPESRGPFGSPVFEGQPALPLNRATFRDSSEKERRPAILLWPAGDPQLAIVRSPEVQTGFAQRNGSRHFRLPVRLRARDASPQVTAARFVARDELFVPKVPYCNVLAVAAPGAPEEPPSPLVPPPPQPVLVRPPAVVKHEEHFDAGWDNWTGDVADWKVDVAGARTGGLALYVPTLDMADYDVEFLARIDSRTVTWVVRAETKDTHLRCALTAVGGGQLEFARTLVRNGVADAPVLSSQRAPGKARMAITVRMSVAGPVFSVSVDGHTIDSWVDDRLAAGGVGFMGTADDRARIYWVRVCSSVAHSKEYTFQ